MTLLRKLAITLLIGAAVTLSSCVDTPFGPDILNVTVTPSVIPLSDTGMGDEYFDVSISTTGFEGEFDSADVFIQLPNGGQVSACQGRPECIQPAEPGNLSTLVSQREAIPTAWFEDQDVGVYSIGATVTTDLEQVTQLDLATVEVVDN